MVGLFTVPAFHLVLFPEETPLYRACVRVWLRQLYVEQVGCDMLVVVPLQPVSPTT